MNQDKDSVCCNHNCNQGRTCPVRLGTHKPAEAVHQIDEPQAEALLELAAYRFTVENREARIAELEAELVEESARTAEQKLRADQISKQHDMQCAMHKEAVERAMRAESQLEAIGAGGVEPLRKQVAPPIAWPKDAQDVRDFFHADFITAQFAAEDLTPCDEDRYLISAHDFLSAVNWWADFPHIPRNPGAAPSAAPVPDERAAFAATQPAAQGLDARKDRDNIFFLAGWNGCNEGLDAHEQFKKATIAAQAKQGEQP